MMLWGISNAQRLKQFSDNRAAFVDELETLMTASKRKVMIETFEQFETVFNSGLFNEEEVKQIIQMGNAMLAERMSPNPYFMDYLKGLTQVKLLADGKLKFQEWHTILEGILSGDGNRKLKPFKEFVRFSNHFFVNNALKYSKSGTSWYAVCNDYFISL